MRKMNIFTNNNLLPAIIQEDGTGEILMLGYMNKESLEKTQNEGYVYFWSRVRKKLWMKGEESGNRLKVKKIFIDCDSDALLIQADLIGTNTCHKGKKSCFYKLMTNTSDRLHMSQI